MYYLRSVRLYLQLFVGELMYYLRSVRLYLQALLQTTGGKDEPNVNKT
jgi:hypothetical protein